MSNKKILFWIEEPFVSFGIAKYLKEEIDADFYSIIVCNDLTKKFFIKQELMKFKKNWFYRDHISLKKQKIDFDYLKSLEDNLGIKIWEIVSGERFFTSYSKYHHFSGEEILSLVEQQSRLYENIIDEIKPDYIAIRIPDFHNIQLLYKIGKAKGVKILMYAQSRFGGLTITEKPDEIIPINIKNTNSEKLKNFKELREHIKEYSLEHEKIVNKFKGSQTQKVNAILHFLTIDNKKYTDYYQNIGKTKLAVTYNKILESIQSYKRKKFIDSNLKKSIKIDLPFIYFPLHVEPEQTLLIRSPFHTDQLNIITNISKSIPVEFKLIIKEHPAMKINGWHDTQFYKKIISLPNVELLHPSISNEDLISKCSLVISIAGTAGLQAAFYNKPSIVLTDVNYTNLSSVYRLKNIEELYDAISIMLKKEVNLSELNEFVARYEESSFNFETMRFAIDAYNNFGYGGFLAESNVTLDKMKYFLEKNKNDFKIMSTEHAKKITNIENQNTTVNSK
jgi:hypothetical protein